MELSRTEKSVNEREAVEVKSIVEKTFSTVTAQVPEDSAHFLATPAYVAVIVAVPTALGVTTPEEFTVATSSSELSQVTVAPSISESFSSFVTVAERAFVLTPSARLNVQSVGETVVVVDLLPSALYLYSILETDIKPLLPEAQSNSTL